MMEFYWAKNTYHEVVVNGQHIQCAQLQRSRNSKNLHWFSFLSNNCRLHLLSKNNWVLCSIFFTYSELCNEMHVVHVESCCYNSTFTDIWFSLLLAKNI